MRTKTPEGKPFSLLNLPYCLAGSLRAYIRWMIENDGAPRADPEQALASFILRAREIGIDPCN